jgi:rsbT co-antagonist protein RsbR
MTTDYASRISTLIQEDEVAIGAQWQTELEAATMRSSAVFKEQVRQQCDQFLALFIAASRSGSLDNIEDRSWNDVRDLLNEISGTRARQGSTPSETATFIFSLKQPLFAALRDGFGNDPQALADASWMLGT